MATTTVLSKGTAKKYPFTVLILANPGIEAPINSSQFIRDPIVADQQTFDRVASFILDSLLGRLPGQREMLFDAAMASAMRVVSVFDSTIPADQSNSLVGQDTYSFELIGRPQALQPHINSSGEYPDIVFAVSASDSHTRSTTWFTQDDDTRGGVAFKLDGTSLTHRYWNAVPGMVSLHIRADALTALHEFQHAISSYTNGKIVDQYVDGAAEANRKVGRPIPLQFGTYSGDAIASDPSRDGIGYEAGWHSYHPAQHDSSLPSVMDNYYLGTQPNSCQNDVLTRRFVTDRIRAKMAR